MPLIELFASDLATTTVTAGGTTAPSSGTQQTLTVASSLMFGAAATGVSQFHFADAAPGGGSEIFACTNVSGTTWTVTRGAESTTPVAHAAGFTIYQVTTAGFLSSPQFSGAVSAAGIISADAGTSTAGSAPVLTPAFANGTAAQLADLTRDYVVYLAVTTSGTATTVAIGPTSAPANTILPSSSVTAGQLISFRLPAGWYVKWSGTTTAIATQTAIGC